MLICVVLMTAVRALYDVLTYLFSVCCEAELYEAHHFEVREFQIWNSSAKLDLLVLLKLCALSMMHDANIDT
jgi:hypothetical protein